VRSVIQGGRIAEKAEDDVPFSADFDTSGRWDILHERRDRVIVVCSSVVACAQRIMWDDHRELGIRGKHVDRVADEVVIEVGHIRSRERATLLVAAHLTGCTAPETVEGRGEPVEHDDRRGKNQSRTGCDGKNAQGSAARCDPRGQQSRPFHDARS
jgi:hypothetical protein